MDKKYYADIFKNAKENTVYVHAITWIKHRLNENGKTDNERFEEITKIVEQAKESLKENN